MQNVLWAPSANPGVLVLAPTPDLLPRQSGGMSDLLPGWDAPEGLHTIRYFSSIPLSAQLVLLRGADPRGALAALIPLDDDTLGRLEALNRFWRASHGRRVPHDTRVTVQQRQRLRLMMRAVDGRKHRASYREIAIALFGRERVASEPWKTSPLRDTVIGLVQGGVAMIGGGYRQLLRHRRRS